VLHASAHAIGQLGTELGKLHSADTTAPIDADKMREVSNALETELGGYKGALYALRNALAKHQADTYHQAEASKPKAKGGKNARPSS